MCRPTIAFLRFSHANIPKRDEANHVVAVSRNPEQLADFGWNGDITGGLPTCTPSGALQVLLEPNAHRLTLRLRQLVASDRVVHELLTRSRGLLCRHEDSTNNCTKLQQCSYLQYRR